ncbi:PIG-L family deacetylase [Aureibaculum sp. 2210JD6-5]|uniref:PIG-L deacetylase family protein n=1 Tax=Aureibaculum sp. 2210JD6-5 TaxID=3103957 RepID=UPI002AACD6AE|nr:PIG-L family deacetylase [Aureibaculum sp. 2210JD6-5]MDY7394015.1 PIG-L family deacetylase [Aureibaculum sp. 2210JD6-5]
MIAKIFSLNKILLFIFIVLSLISIYFVIHYRTSIYNYEVNLNYQYDFSNSQATKFDIYVVNNKMFLPNLENKNVTAFVKIEISGTFLSKIFKPSVDLITTQDTITNYFEYNLKGIRYINISELIASGVKEIDLVGNHIKIKDKKVELFVFDNLNFQDSKVLIIAPHPDDAEIAAYGMYAKNNNSFIITITAGEAGSYNYDEVYNDSVTHYLKKGKLRTWNSITVPLLGNVNYQNILNLGFFNGTLKNMYENDSAIFKSVYGETSEINTFRKQNISDLSNGLTGVSNWNSLVKNLTYLLDTIKPNLIIAPYPLIDSHLDHKYSTIALIEALKKSKKEDGHLLLYTNHHPLSESYPYGESESIVTLPPNFNNELYFTNIYSNSLSTSLQKDKLFALEAMNDLRLDTEWREPKGAIQIALKTIKRKLLGPNIDYYRRAVRANELFFVIPIKDIYDKEKLKIISDKIIK